MNTGRSPTVGELAQSLELSIEDMLEGLEAAAAPHSSSLDAPHDDGDGESVTLVDTLGQGDACLQLVEDATTVAGAMQMLSERERRVLHRRFFEDRTQSEIAAQIGISQMQISRILRGATAGLSELTLSDTPSQATKGLLSGSLLPRWRPRRDPRPAVGHRPGRRGHRTRRVR